jgi:hypothetical protein
MTADSSGQFVWNWKLYLRDVSAGASGDDAFYTVNTRARRGRGQETWGRCWVGPRRTSRGSGLQIALCAGLREETDW